MTVSSLSVMDDDDGGDDDDVMVVIMMMQPVYCMLYDCQLTFGYG